MNELKTDYEALYQHWLKEFERVELTPLTQYTFNEYKKTRSAIKDIQEFNERLKDELLKDFKANYNYMFSDLLKVREIKIINSALALKEVNFEDILEAERLFYQNLVGAIKGYEKVKALSILDRELTLAPEFPKTTQETKVKNQNVDKSKLLDSIITDHAEHSQSDEYAIQYILIRLIKKTPPLVGIDLLNYGPFEQDDIANIPFKNAKILISEKFAEKLEIN